MPRATNVAKEVIAYCTSCKMDLNHIIVAMQGDRIAKVQCRTCNKEHTFKAPKGIAEPAKPAKKTKKQAAADEAKSTPIESEWERLMTLHKAAAIKTYSSKTAYVIGDKIQHPTFGEGIVGRLIYPNKIEVIFQHDMKVLIHTAPVTTTTY